MSPNERHPAGQGLLSGAQPVEVEAGRSRRAVRVGTIPCDRVQTQVLLIGILESVIALDQVPIEVVTQAHFLVDQLRTLVKAGASNAAQAHFPCHHVLVLINAKARVAPYLASVPYHLCHGSLISHNI